MALLGTVFPGRPVPGRRWLAAGFALALLVAARAAVPAPTAEYQVKAVFLFNFAQFVEWPANAFRDEQAPLIIGVLGEDPFGPYLEELVRSEKIEGRTLVVQRYRLPEEIAACHILFVSRTVAGQFDKTAKILQGRSLLTVGEGENFNRLGGMVGFVTEKGKIRLRINLGAAQASGLVISSKLLRVATIFNPEQG